MSHARARRAARIRATYIRGQSTSREFSLLRPASAIPATYWAVAAPASALRIAVCAPSSPRRLAEARRGAAPLIRSRDERRAHLLVVQRGRAVQRDIGARRGVERVEERAAAAPWSPAADASARKASRAACAALAAAAAVTPGSGPDRLPPQARARARPPVAAPSPRPTRRRARALGSRSRAQRRRSARAARRRRRRSRGERRAAAAHAAGYDGRGAVRVRGRIRAQIAVNRTGDRERAREIRLRGGPPKAVVTCEDQPKRGASSTATPQPSASVRSTASKRVSASRARPSGDAGNAAASGASAACGASRARAPASVRVARLSVRESAESHAVIVSAASAAANSRSLHRPRSRRAARRAARRRRPHARRASGGAAKRRERAQRRVADRDRVDDASRPQHRERRHGQSDLVRDELEPRAPHHAAVPARGARVRGRRVGVGRRDHRHARERERSGCAVAAGQVAIIARVHAHTEPLGRPTERRAARGRYVQQIKERLCRHVARRRHVRREATRENSRALPQHEQTNCAETNSEQRFERARSLFAPRLGASRHLREYKIVIWGFEARPAYQGIQ